MKRPILVLLAAGVLAVGVGGAQPGAQEVTLKAASFLPERVAVTKPFYRWARETSKRCEGKLKINVVGPAAIPSLEQWSAVKNGVVDMAYTPANYYRGAIPEADVFVVSDTPPTEQRANGAWALINELHNRKLNSWYLTTLSSGVEFYFYTSKPAVNGRLEGYRIRSVPLYDSILKALGAIPIRISASAIYTSMERGTVDGYGWPAWGIGDLGLDKFTKHRYGPGFFSAASPIFVNLDKWKSLTGAQRQCLTDATVWVEKIWPEWRAAEDDVQRQVFKRAGITYGELDRSIMLKAEEDYWNILAKANPEFIGKVKPLLTGSK